MLKTCRLPVLIHSFDPGGSDVLKKEIADGKILVDNRFETDEILMLRMLLDSGRMSLGS